MDATSPTKRRAALAPKNANILASPRGPMQTKVLAAGAASPLKLGSPRKRAPEENLKPLGTPALKKICVERDEPHDRSRSHSPATSSIFDISAGDASWTTTLTEPDTTDRSALRPVSTTAPRPAILTREQAREKVELLRLRLGLASYKVRTGQTSIPLAELQLRPLPSGTHSNTLSKGSTRLSQKNPRQQNEAEDAIATGDASEPRRDEPEENEGLEENASRLVDMANEPSDTVISLEDEDMQTEDALEKEQRRVDTEEESIDPSLKASSQT